LQQPDPSAEPLANRDSLTILHSRGIHAAKQFTLIRGGGGAPDRIAVQPYGNAKHFGVEEIPIDGFTSMAAALEQASRDPYVYIVRGAPLPAINRKHARRLLYPDNGDPASFCEAARHWFALDFDHLAAPPLCDPVNDPEAIVEHLIALLPAEVQDAFAWWQLSSSMAVPLANGADRETVSARLWFWSRVALSNAELNRWAATRVNGNGRIIDASLFRAVQPHYIAAPLFHNMADPLARRSGIRQGLDEEVELEIPEVDEPSDAVLETHTWEPGIGVDAYLDLIGGPDGFRGPIMSAIASYIGRYGANTDCEALKEQIRARIAAADPGGRNQKEIERYASDKHLDDMIMWARKRQGDRPAPWLLLPPGAAFRSASDAAVEEEKEEEGKDAEAESTANPPKPLPEGVSLSDFYAYLPQHRYIFAPSRETWPAESINGRFPRIPLRDNQGRQLTDSRGKPFSLSPANWLDRHRPVEQMTWAPGLPMIIEDRLLVEGGWIDRPGVAADHAARRSRPCQAVARSRRADLPRRYAAHSVLARASRAAPTREDQPRAGAERPAGDWQGYDPGADQALPWRVEFPRGQAQPGGRAVQFVFARCDRAGQRIARSRRNRLVPLLWVYEGLHGGPARDIALRREEPP
jgi:hypothetical protein